MCAGGPGTWSSPTEPKPGLLEAFDRHGGTGKPRVGQLPVCYDTDRDTAIKRAHAQFRWFGNGWKVNSELPHPDSFESATQFVTPDDVAGSIPCGDDPEAFVEAVRPYAEAGFTEIALVQIGGETQAEEPGLVGEDPAAGPARRAGLTGGRRGRHGPAARGTPAGHRLLSAGTVRVTGD
ncbi:hypothetical protein SGLAM104S_02660 [Streptomyces glaucescens]